MSDLTEPYCHRILPRCKYLGESITSEQLAAISSGTFDDLFIGDYWVNADHNWRIVDIDPWYYGGNTIFTSHHILVMPDDGLYTYAFNTTATTDGGYVGSDLYKNGLTEARSMFADVFGSSHVLTHAEPLVTTVSNGLSTSGGWQNVDVVIPSEFQVYGGFNFTPACTGTTTTYMNILYPTQFALFSAIPYFICPSRQYWWLRDVVNSTQFAVMASNCDSYRGNANTAYWIRPVAAIG